MPVVNLRVTRLDTFGARLFGLLLRPPPPPGVAVWLLPCRQVHALGMRYAIDVVYLDRGGTVLAVETLRPFRLGRRIRGAHSVLELAAGEAARLGLEAGSVPCLIEVEPDANER
jgi:uncharacterized membrane protein (UPF0127 family)